MRKERYIHDESYIGALTTTKAVVVRIFHAHVFDFKCKKQLLTSRHPNQTKVNINNGTMPATMDRNKKEKKSKEERERENALGR